MPGFEVSPKVPKSKPQEENEDLKVVVERRLSKKIADLIQETSDSEPLRQNTPGNNGDHSPTPSALFGSDNNMKQVELIPQ